MKPACSVSTMCLAPCYTSAFLNAAANFIELNLFNLICTAIKSIFRQNKYLHTADFN